MASFNGTKIKDTYQGIIKTIDNNTATGTLKELTDGNGNTLGIHLNTAGDMTIEGNSTVDGIIDSAGGNKIGFLFANQAAFPDATTYHGAVAHSHADGKLYFSHAGAWVELALASDNSYSISTSAAIDFDSVNHHLTVSGAWSLSLSNISGNLGKSGVIVITNSAATSTPTMPTEFKTPNGDTAIWNNTSGNKAMLSYYIVDSTTILTNYIGNFA